MPTGVVILPLRGRRFAGAHKPACSAGKTSLSPVIDGFIAGQENALIAGVIGKFLSAIESPDDRPNQEKQWLARRAPLLLLGPTGCGKTHLARGVAELWHGKFGADKVAYLTASDFHRQFADAMGDQRTEAVRAELRSCQLVVIEDLDRLSQADYLQHELVMLLDALAASGGVLLATATKPLVQAVGFTRPVLSRFAGGLNVELARLERAARAELVVRTFQALGWPYELAAVELLAEELSGDAGEIFQIATRLTAACRGRQPVSVALVRTVLAAKAAEPSLPLAELARIVGNYCGVTLKMLTSSSRRKTVVLARALTIYLARRHTPLSFEEIGRYFGGRDHTTIMHNQQRIERERLTDPLIAAALRVLESRVVGRN
jgi:chromosomal replication initiator protein